jgi:hypothetical protein
MCFREKGYSDYQFEYVDSGHILFYYKTRSYLAVGFERFKCSGESILNHTTMTKYHNKLQDMYSHKSS